jgi:tetratricopeptide (TPR) repeat protein
LTSSQNTNYLFLLSHFSRNFFVYILLVITVLVFANSTFNGYNYDDTLVTQNQPLTSSASLSSIQRIFSGSYYQDSSGHAFGYRPIVLLSFAVEHSLFSENPFISHSINVLLYCLSGFLFFKLLTKFVGTDKAMLAFLAALIFVVHPVHSEVVASIKNRDEILAFLFVMLSGLSALKYLEKKSVYLIFFSALFFVIGMLSKKSIFPLVIVFPIVFLLLKEVNWKELLIITLSFVLPGAIVGSDFELTKFILLMIIPLLVIGLSYFFYSIKTNNLISDKNTILFGESLLSIISWSFIGLAIYNLNLGYVFLSFLVLTISQLEIKKNVFQMLLQFVVIGYFFKSYDFFIIAFLISTAFAIYTLLNKKADFLNISIVIFSVIGMLYIGTTLSVLLLMSFVFLFGYVSFRNPKIGVFLAVVNLTISLIYFKTGLFQIALLAFSIVLNFNFLKSYFLTYMKIGILAFVFVSMSYISFEANYFPSLMESFSKTSGGKEENIQNYLKNLSSKNEISEGRRLEYMENTLVAPHTLNEKMATGLVVLGEYGRLMVFPYELSFYYGYSKIMTTDFTNYKVWIYLLVYLSLFILGIYQINKRPLISIGIAWYLISIFLFSNWVELVAGMVGERLAFTASAGFSVFVAAVVFALKPSFNFFKPRKLEFVVIVFLLLFSVRTYSRNLEWKGSVGLMSTDIVHLENSAQANNMLALSLMNESVTNSTLSNETRSEYQKKAVIHLSKAISIYPYFFNYHFDLGRTYVVQQDYLKAKKAFVDAYKLQPENILALEELTRLCFDLKQKEETVYYGNLYLKTNPANEKINEFVAYICLLNKDFVSAKKYAERGLIYFPNNENFKHMIIDSSH